MMYFIYNILPAIIFYGAIFFLVYLARKKKRERHSTNPQNHEPSFNDDDTIFDFDNEDDFRGKYQARDILSVHEWVAFQKLRQLANAKDLYVCPKVRLLDIIEPAENTRGYKTLLYKVQSKHLDFVLCNERMTIKVIIELDDNSHNRIDRIERDQFVDSILQDVGYTIIHTRNITDDILDGIY